MFKNQNIKFLLLGIVLLITISLVHTYLSINENKNIRTMILVEEARSIVSFFKSFRKTYQDIFIEKHIKLTSETISLLPVKTSNQISDNFSKSLNARITLRTVSDRPRNLINMANEQEMKIIKEFKKTSKEYIFEKDDQYDYRYYEPLYVTNKCLKCHGKKEDAPQMIRDNYTRAFDYKLNDLRGIISIEIDKNTLLTKLDKKDKHNLIYIGINMLIFTLIILFLYFKLLKNNEKSKKDLMIKNDFLQRKAKEFDDLQSALGISEIISKADINGVITSVNDKFCEVSGYTRDELIGSNHNIVRHPDTADRVFKKMWNTIQNKQVFKGILKNKRKDGTSYHVDSTIVPILNEDGEIEEYLAIRHYIEDMMNHKVLLQEVIKGSTKSILILAKIEGFEEIEEFYTEDVIVKLEQKFVRNALSYFPANCQFDKVYKLENGEFAFIKEIDDCEKFIKERTSLIEEFQSNVKKVKYLINGYEFNPSILISFSTAKDDIYENAKLGLKKLIKENKTIINANDLIKQARINAQKNIDTVKVIKDAIDTQNIVSYFQPLYNNKSKKIEKYESLVRLIDKDSKVISPFFFLDVAKKAKYYNRITQLVIDNSFKTLKTIKEDVSINLSFLDIEDEETREYLYSYIDKCQECHRIVIELLEDETAKEFKVIQEFIARVKIKGVKIAIDDFGAGYSNFERLLDFQPDILKIDGSLIKNIQTDNYSRNIVETIQAFAKKEGIQTVAEFVSNKEIFDIVNEIGIDYTQGYYISEPKPL